MRVVECFTDPDRAVALREDIVNAYRELSDAGLNQGSSGNISMRLGGRILITPTGAQARALMPEHIVDMDFDGRAAEGIPSSEWHFHAEIYRRFIDVQAVIHTHADHCVALSCLGEDLPSFHYMVAAFGGDDVRCAPYATFGTRALAEAVVQALADRKACLLANHGMVAIGKDMKQALGLTIKLETLVRQYLLARQSGTPKLISRDEMARVRDRYRHYGTARLQA